MRKLLHERCSKYYGRSERKEKMLNLNQTRTHNLNTITSNFFFSIHPSIYPSIHPSNQLSIVSCSEDDGKEKIKALPVFNPYLNSDRI
jgi:hypothetical protein